MNINNIKIHVRVKPLFLTQYREALINQVDIHKKTSSFITFKYDCFTYTCFHSGFVNVTGIKRRKDKHKSIQSLETNLNLQKKSFTKPVVDNISSNWLNKDELKKINLLVILTIALKHDTIKEAKYNREKFPALFLKTYWGTILWYGSPAVIAVGSKTKKDVKYLTKVVQSILRDVNILHDVDLL